MSDDEALAPYVGPRAFEPEDQVNFFGRDREASDLLSLIVCEPAVLLYSPSGAGKTSLLQARIIPLLKKKEAEVFGTARVKGTAPSDVRNVFVFNTLMSLQDGPVPAADRLTLRLPDYLETQEYPEISDANPPRRVLIFDQFEEIFTSYPDRWQDREAFFDEIGEALDEDSCLRVVFAMREEYIASLDPYARRLPDRMRTRFRLEPLRRAQALRAVVGPLEAAPVKRSFAPKVAETLVDNLLHVPTKTPGAMAVASSEFVDPMQLQVVCQRLWRSLPDSAQVIDEHYLQAFGDVDAALREYYEECVDEVARETGTSALTIRSWFEEALIMAEGSRNLAPRGATHTSGLRNDVVDRLEALHLVRTEMRGGARWHELAHDRLIYPIRASNQEASKGSLGAAEVREQLQNLLRDLGDFRDQVRSVANPAASPENLQWLHEATLRWQLTLAPLLAKPQRIRLLPWPEEPVAAGKPMADPELRRWLSDRAYLQSMIRKVNAHLRQPRQRLYKILESVTSDKSDEVQDWCAAELVFALEVLEGRLHLTRRLGPEAWPQLEKMWLSDVKRTKAYLLWEERGEDAPDRHRSDYENACAILRRRLVDEEAKAPAHDFDAVERYLRERFLSSRDQFDENKPAARQLLNQKAQRISETSPDRDPDGDWYNACEYSRMFYDHILPAVRKKDQDATLSVLQAFQFSRAPENRYLIIDCFEAGLAIYFLDAGVIREIWDEAILPESLTL